MTYLAKLDSKCYYFSFEFYLYEQELDSSIIDYLENNNVNDLINSVCFYNMIDADTHYLVTRSHNEYKIITISKSDINENIISHNIIIYNNYEYIISQSMQLNEIEIKCGISNLNDITKYVTENYKSNFIESHYNIHFNSNVLQLRTIRQALPYLNCT
jgi:hypothetical protein